MSYTTILFNIAAGLIYTPWMIKQIGKADYGLFALVTSFLTYFIMDFGLSNAIARFIAKFKAEKQENKVNELLGLTTKLYLIMDLSIMILLVILYFFIDNIYVKLTPNELHKFKNIFCIAGLFALVSFPFTSINSILIAYERFFVLKLCELSNKFFTIILMIIALFAGYGLYALIIVHAFMGITIIIIKLIYLSKTTPIKINIKYKNKDLLKQLLNVSIWITVISIAQRLLITITPTILAIFAGSGQIAIFAIGVAIEGYTWTFANALNGLFLPKVSRMVAANDDRKGITDLMIKVGRIQLLIIGCIIIGFACLGKQFITLWIGNDFRQSYYVIMLLILPGLITLTQEIANTLLFAVNELKYRALLFIGASIISVILSVLLSPRLGAIGSAIGICTALLMCHIIGMNIVYQKILSLDIGRFFRKCHIKMLVPMTLSFGAGILINNYIPAKSIILFIPKAALFAIIYITLMWMISLNDDEKSLIKGFAKKLSVIKKPFAKSTNV